MFEARLLQLLPILPPGDVKEGTLKQLFIPSSGDEIASKFRADFEASSAKLNASLKSLFEPKAPAAPQRLTPQPTGAALPKHRIGEFRDRLTAPLRTIEK